MGTRPVVEPIASAVCRARRIGLLYSASICISSNQEATGSGLLATDVGQCRIGGLPVVAHDSLWLTMAYEDQFHAG